MRFFFQLNLQTIPAELNEKFGQGILQLFYCTNEIRIVSDHPTNAMEWTEETAEGPQYIHYQSCEYECGGGEQFSACQFVRIVQADGVSQNVEIPATGECLSMVGEGDFPPRLIIDWRRIDDYPSGDEVIAQGIQLSADDQDYLRDSGTYPQGDKLSGWPGWTQQIEYPDCPICHQEMAQLIFQIASDDHIPFLWGDVGEGYIFQCPEHRSEVAFLYQE
jgi:hypothetical protein